MHTHEIAAHRGPALEELKSLAAIYVALPVASRSPLLSKFKKLVRFHGADLVFTGCGDQGDRQDRLAAWDGSQGASIGVEEVLEGVLFDV